LFARANAFGSTQLLLEVDGVDADFVFAAGMSMSLSSPLADASTAFPAAVFVVSVILEWIDLVLLFDKENALSSVTSSSVKEGETGSLRYL